MVEYHKIQTVFKRDPATKHRTLLEGEYSLPEFEYLKNNIWTLTEKVDGTNIRVNYDPDYGVTFGGRTERAQIPATLVTRLQELFPMGKLISAFDCSVTLYGEGFGPKIQNGGGNYGENQDFVLFDVMINGIWLERNNVEDIADKLGIQVVPVCAYDTLLEMVEAIKAGGAFITSRWGDFQLEGYVARPETEMLTRTGKRIITKIKCRDFPNEIPAAR